jgi:hypothetical protein
VPGDLAERLVAMAGEDLAKRAELVERGELFDGYHPEMRAVHDRNAAALLTVIDESGWPTRSTVGQEAAEAAWLIVQHAIGHPALQRRCRALIAHAVRDGEAEPAQLAMLEDRIRLFEGRRQLYGTHFDWDEAGELSPQPIEDPEEVDARRAATGLPPLAQRQAELRAQAARESDGPPADRAERRRAFEAWLRETGWRSG